MTFQEIFKSSFLENVASVSLLDMTLALALAFGIGLFILMKPVSPPAPSTPPAGVTACAPPWASCWRRG